MAYEEKLECISVPASGDLSSHQFKAMQLDANGRAALATNASDVIGVLQNNPDAAGKAASIGVKGVTKLLALSTAITPGDLIKPSTVGLGVPSTSATGFARAMEALSSTATAIISVHLDRE